MIGGVVGARLYHVATDYEKFEGDWLRVFEIWKGGLSIWGVVAGGVIAVVIVCRVKHLEHAADLRRDRARPPRRPGDRSVGQLVQPGALR